MVANTLLGDRTVMARLLHVAKVLNTEVSDDETTEVQVR